MFSIIRPRCFGMMTPDAYCQSVKSQLKLTYCFSVVSIGMKIRAVQQHRPRDILSLSTTGYGCKLFQLAITQLIDLFCKQLAFLFRAAATRNHPLPIRIKCNIGVTLSFRQFCRCHPMHIRYHNLIAVRIKHWRSVFFEQMCTNVNIRIPRNMNIRMLPAIR